MRYFVGLVCVLALGVMGCGQSLGPVGGSGGDGGVGGVGGNGGIGGGVVTDCTGEETFTRCTIDGVPAWCWLEQCAAFDCSGLEDGTYCEFTDPGVGTKGVCEAGRCTKPEDCTGLVDGWDCIKGDFGCCADGECVPCP